MYATWPHGLCECRQGCQCEDLAGPAAYRATREDGRVLKVCTRCTLTSDKGRELLCTTADPADPLMEYDTLGGFLVVMELCKDTEATA